MSGSNRRCVWFWGLGAMVLLAWPHANGLAEEPTARLLFASGADNDLYRVLQDGGANYPRYDQAGEAIRAAANEAGVLVLADGYPQNATRVDPSDLALARRKKLRLYVEFPAELPGIELGLPRQLGPERGVVTSDFFGDALPPMQIVMIHGCRFLPADAENPHLALARVAGVDTAVFGLEETQTWPVLFEHPRGDLLVATSKLSHFVTARYMPTDAWQVIWRTILRYLQPGKAIPRLTWTPTVRPSYHRDEPLPEDAGHEALTRSADWFFKSRILRHPDWPPEALDQSSGYNVVRDMPADDWPPGDGSLGMLEGFSSTIRCDGSQPMRYGARNDCMSEIAMALAFNGVINSDPRSTRVAARALDYVLVDSMLAQGPRADPDSPSYGLVGWSLDHPGSYWGDDNARAILGVLAAGALLKDPRWDEATVRCLLANFRTTGVYGYRQQCITENVLQARGWESYWTGRYTYYSPHFEAWLWACFLWAYDKTGFEPFLERSKTGARRLMAAYPDHWNWCLRSGQIERARALLPLSWLIRVEDTPEHRRWLRRVAEDLLALQDDCGAIREAIGDGGYAVASNAQYQTGESSLIQIDGDPISDSLYTCNFALIGLHEAAAATGDPLYAEAEEKLARFLCRIQIRSEAHPELDGAWYRAFDFSRWEYWGSSSDWEWGPWCTESGWTQPWIAGTLALREMDTSLWELTAASKINAHFDRYRRQMLPDQLLEVALPEEIRHQAVGKPVRLAHRADPRYPGVGPTSLSDGILAGEDFRDGDWLGFEGLDLEATVDLAQPTQIRRLAADFLQQVSVGIFLPSQVELAVSDDGKRWRTVATLGHDVPPQQAGPLTRTFTADGLTVRARYVRVIGRSVATIPDEHSAAGRKAWLFVDEIIVE